MSETLALPRLYVDYRHQAADVEYLGRMENTIEPSIEHLPMPLASEVIYTALIIFLYHNLKSTLSSCASNLYKLDFHTVKVIHYL